jgi:hypothetical protein
MSENPTRLVYLISQYWRFQDLCHVAVGGPLEVPRMATQPACT